MRYYIIAGEASGDLHASNLMKGLKIADPEAAFRFWGGDLMKAQGGELVKHYRDLAFMGFTEVLSHLPVILRNFRFCEKDILQYHPDVLILVDYPGFNLRMAQFASRNGIRVFYYISPQLWAWHQSRVKKIKAYVDRMFVILPFEKEFYARHDYPVDYLGHPLLDVINDRQRLKDRSLFIGENNLTGKPIIALLPGSRKMEIRKMLGNMLSVKGQFPDHQFVVAAAPSVDPAVYRQLISGMDVQMVSGQTYDLLSNASAALVASGTATLETALLGTPQVVCYKGNHLSYLLAKGIVKVPYISLVNLVLNRPLVSELIQNLLTPDNLERELKELLNNAEKRAAMLSGYAHLKEQLGGPGASERVARLMVQYLLGN